MTKTAVLLLFLALISFLYCRPHEYILGHWDPGTYMNTGFQIANHGSIAIWDPLLVQMSPEEMKLFVWPRSGAVFHPGFYLKDPNQGTIVPQFYHVYPVWIAIFLKLFGAYGSLFVNPLFALLSLWTLWVLLKNMFSPTMALVACVFLGLSVPQIWNARFPTSEILAQYFVLSGIYTFYFFERDKNEPAMSLRAKRSNLALNSKMRLLRDFVPRNDDLLDSLRPKFFGILSGSSFALALLTRPTALLLIPCLALYFAFRNWGRLTKRDLAFGIPLGLGLLHLFLQTRFLTGFYAQSVTTFFSSREKIFYSILATVLTASFIAARIFRKNVGPILNKSQNQKLAGGILALSILGLSIYGYWIRPRLGSSQEFFNLVHLVSFIGPLSLIFAILGAMLWCYRGLHPWNLLLVIITLVETVFFLDQKRTFSSYPWALKRYTPVVLPALAIYAAYFLDELRRKLKWRKFVITALVCIAVFLPLKKGALFITQTDYKGLTSFLKSLNAKMDPDGIYLLDEDRLAIPLQHLYEKRTLVLPEVEKIPKVEPLLLRWLQSGKKIYYIGFNETPYSEKLLFKIIAPNPESLHTSYLESSFGTYPTRIREVQYNPKIFQVLELSPSLQEPVEEFFIDIGENKIGVLEGFDKARVFKNSFTGRWTTGKARMVLPWPIEQKAGELILRVGGKPLSPQTKNDASLTRLSLLINNKILAKDVPVPSDMSELRFSIPPGFLEEHTSRATLTLESDAWNPYDQGIKGFPYRLGVLVDWIKIRRQE